MGYNMDQVEKAAAFLDGNVGKLDWLTADWRTRIDVSKFDINNEKDCVLGQLKGDYYEGKSDLKDVDYDGFNGISDAFHSYNAEWKEYIARYEMVGSEWHCGSDWNTACCKYIIKAVNLIDGEEWVTYKRNGSVSLQVMRLSNLERDYKRKPVKPAVRFVKGDMLKSNDPRYVGNVFLYISDMRVLRLNTGSPGYDKLSYYENDGYTLSKIRNNASTSDAEWLKELSFGELDLTK